MTRLAGSGDGRAQDGSGRVDRRGFFASAGAATVGMVLAREGTAVAEPAGAQPGAASEAVVITAVGPGRRLTVRRLDGRTLEVVDARGRERWHPGDEAVLDRKHTGSGLRVVGVSRLYRPILDERVTARSGNVLHTESGPPVVLTGATRFPAHLARGVPAARAETVAAGDVIAGLVYVDARTATRVAVQLGVVAR